MPQLSFQLYFARCKQLLRGGISAMSAHALPEGSLSLAIGAPLGCMSLADRLAAQTHCAQHADTPSLHCSACSHGTLLARPWSLAQSLDHFPAACSAGFSLLEILKHVLRRQHIVQLRQGGAARRNVTFQLQQSVEHIRSSWSMLEPGVRRVATALCRTTQALPGSGSFGNMLHG